jgi:hypothetical protein
MGRMCDIDITLRDSLATLSKKEFITIFGSKKYEEYRRKVDDEDTRIESSGEPQ